MNAGGAAAVECSSTNVSNCNDGSGGGGAGGSILLNVNNFPSILTAGVNGGKGASLYAYTTTSGRVGPGGGGAGGVIWTKQTSLPSNLVSTLTGGANGVIIADSNNPWGTTPGQTGITLTGLVVPIDSVIFKPNIDSVRIKDSITGCKSFDFKGFAFTNSHPISSWHWDFGDGTVANTQNTSHNFVTAANYTVKLTVTDINGCKDSTNIGVTTGGLNIDYYYQENICNPLSVQFFNTLSSGINISWDWGDGTFSNGVSNPTHIFTATGTYPVQLSLQVGTCRDTILKNIQVGATPFNIITTPDTTICSGKTANLLTIPSLGFCWTPVTYLNDPLSDHPVTATPLPIQYFFTAEIPGTNLVTNGDFSSGDIGFTSDYTTENPNINEGRYEVGNSPAAWNSSFNACSDHSSGSGKMLMVNGNGTANAIIWKETVSVTPQTNYTFSAWLTTLSVNNPASLSFSINGLDMGALIPPGSPGCNWKRYFTNWNSGNLTAATIAIINKNTGIGGNDFALDDISFSPVQIKRDSILISIDTPVLHTRTDTTVCKGIPVMLHTSGNGTNFTWSPANGLDNIFSANPMATPADTTQYFVTATTNHGCSIKDSVTISILASPVITMTNDTSVCPNQGVQLQAAGGISYSWTPAGTLNNASIPNPVASPTVSPTIYYLAVTGANQCISRDSVKISIIPNPVFTVSPNQSACRGTAATLTASGGNIYTWTPAFPLNNSTIPTPQATPDSTTIFTVVITESACNRSATLQTILHIDSVPVLALKKSNDLDCSKTSAQLQATGADTYVWSPNLGLSNDSIANPLAFYSITQTYLVLGTDSLTGCKGSDTITVFYNVPPGVTYKAPTAFSPNGDGVNDCFKVLYTGVFDYFELSIYNRWGNRVFFSTDPNECWDGTLNGYPLEMSNYVYMIKTRNPCGETVSKGNLVLIR